MRSRIQKWGNSLALRIPKAFALDAQLENDSVVDVALADGQIIIKRVVSETWTLEDLLEGISSGTMHREADTGEAVGNEVW